MATERIRECATDRRCTIHWKAHVLEVELPRRGLIVDDVLHVLRCGSVRSEAKPSDADGYYRYDIAHRTPSDRRVLVVTVLPGRRELKIMDLKWKNEL